ncbi:alpha-tocopherol transfer protein-like [Rhipicephalus sanguineus]|uniref:alpha-tocopherol transfer protein-like n=1 Tax=Rhipicephalus sanguineus TaxID=34632 RepID=UPI0018937A3B|nr:alpha-tocopherol transfer protein-like [Rhipicephalus sanguineus]
MAGSPPSSEDFESDGPSPASPVSPTTSRELEHLKKLIDRDESLNAKMDSDFLMAFLRFCHAKHKRAFEVLKRYYDSKRKEADLFRNLLPSELDHVFSRNLVGLLPEKDRKGRFILILRAGAWNPNQVSFIDAVRAILLCFEYIMTKKGAQENGLSMLCDFDGWGYSSILAVPSSRIGGITGIFPGYPIRKKRVDIVKQPYSFNVFFKMVTPFLDAASIAKVHLHGTDTKALHKRFPAKILPKEFGGTRGPFDASVCYEWLKAKEAAFAEDFEYGYIQD